jgi:hypothetical protein
MQGRVTPGCAQASIKGAFPHGAGEGGEASLVTCNAF